MDNIKLKYELVEDEFIPHYAHDGDAGLDLMVRKDVTLRSGEDKMVPLGIKFEIPTGCVGLLFPRSGFSTKEGITLKNSVGVIDSNYRGEVKAVLKNTSQSFKVIYRGTRVCQLVVMPFCTCKLEETNFMNATERGTKGFGSSGC